MGLKEHKAKAPHNLTFGVLSMSSTRTVQEDESGNWIIKRIEKEGHTLVSRSVIPDEEAEIRSAVRDIIRMHQPDVIILTGGTGISNKDVTIEAIEPMVRKELTAFATLFAMLSYEQIDSAAILSRATAGIISNTVAFCIPGSLKACKLACKALIFPEVGHIVAHIKE